MSRTPEELEHGWAELAQQAGKLCRVAELFSDKVKNPVWAEGLIDEVATTRGLLAKAPSPRAWDGELREEDLEIETYRAPAQYVDEEAKGVRITHRPTGITRESYSKNSQLANREVVMGSLRDAVNKRYKTDNQGS